MKCTYGKEFTNEFKQLQKRYHTLDSDFNLYLDVVKQYPKGNGSRHWNIISNDKDMCVMGSRMMCQALRSSSKIRVIYAVTCKGIIFIEIFFKQGTKIREDSVRVKEYVG